MWPCPFLYYLNPKQMIQVTKHGVILEKTNLDFENEGVLNPGVIVHENQIHL